VDHDEFALFLLERNDLKRDTVLVRTQEQD
jgi:hypothetical protein